MKALSLRQPFATLVVYYDKWIENRRWYTSYRGPFLIHAAKSMTRQEFDETLDFARDVLGIARCPTERELRDKLQFGGIIGRATLVDVVGPRPEPSLLPDVRLYYPSSVVEWRWHMPAQFGFVLEDVKPLTFHPCRGMLNFFDVPWPEAA